MNRRGGGVRSQKPNGANPAAEGEDTLSQTTETRQRVGEQTSPLLFSQKLLALSLPLAGPDRAVRTRRQLF